MIDIPFKKTAFLVSNIWKIRKFNLGFYSCLHEENQKVRTSNPRFILQIKKTTHTFPSSLDNEFKL